MEETRLPLIVDIKRHSLEDGPGIRSVVFFKGCPLRCLFCQNPETQHPGPEIAHSPGDCLRCGACVKACPSGAIDLSSPGAVLREKCNRCGACAAACPGKGLRAVGVYYSPEALAEVLLRDLPFYRHSGGGVTLSGGEATLYPDYLQALLVPLKRRGIHVALETCGAFDYGSFERQILPWVDLIYYDIKIADPSAHEKYTGRGNRTILDNLRRLVGDRKGSVHPRVPFVPGITDTRENLAAVVGILYEAGAEQVALLSYNPMGLEMTERLGRTRPPLPGSFMTAGEEGEIRARFQAILAEKAAARPAGP
jgi:pyruvate formate lyase activating enzyme